MQERLRTGEGGRSVRRKTIFGILTALRNMHSNAELSASGGALCISPGQFYMLGFSPVIVSRKRYHTGDICCPANSVGVWRVTAQPTRVSFYLGGGRLYFRVLQGAGDDHSVCGRAASQVYFAVERDGARQGNCFLTTG